MKSTKDSTPETQGGWNTFGMNAQRWTRGRITFSWLELTNDDDVRSMFSIFWQDNMFPWIDMFVMLMRLPEDILNSLIPPKDYD